MPETSVASKSYEIREDNDIAGARVLAAHLGEHRIAYATEFIAAPAVSDEHQWIVQLSISAGFRIGVDVQAPFVVPTREHATNAITMLATLYAAAARR